MVIGGTSIFGGVGGYPGTILGAIILVVLDSLLTLLDASQAYREIIYGLIILGLAWLYATSTKRVEAYCIDPRDRLDAARGAGSAPAEGVRGSATVPLRRAPPCIHDPRPCGHAGRTIDHLVGDTPVETTVIGSYPFPGWLEFASRHLASSGRTTSRRQDDATRVAIEDQVATGLDVVTDGEQSRLDFNLSFYGFLQGIDLDPRRPASGRRPTTSGGSTRSPATSAPRGLGAVEEYQRLERLAPGGAR